MNQDVSEAQLTVNQESTGGKYYCKLSLIILQASAFVKAQKNDIGFIQPWIQKV